MSVSSGNRIESQLLRKINERRLLDVIQHKGPLSRAAIARVSGLTAPTVSKAVDSLLKHGFIEEIDPPEQLLGRPGKLVRMAVESAAVIGISIDTHVCCVVSAGLDGGVTEARTRRFVTPSTYDALIDDLESRCRELLDDIPGRMHGIGVCAPGLVNDRLGEIVFCPNLHLLDKRNPARDLEARLAVKAVLLQEIDGLCLSEWMYGVARSLNDFALLDVSVGLGMGVMCSGRLLGGRSGMAGELGHITVNPDGVRCGCGNHGCLETLATDTALVRLISEKDGISRSLTEVATALDERPSAYEHEVRTTSEYLAIAIAAAINICNPTMLFVHGTLLVANEERFARVLELVKNRTLTASLAECTIVPTKSSKRQAAIAGIMHHLTSDWAPAIP